MQNVASLFGAGRMRAASGGARVGLVAGIDDLVEFYAIKGVDAEILDPAAFGTMVQQSLTNSQKFHTRILTEGFGDLIQDK